MSVLIAYILDEGIIFAADKNLTSASATPSTSTQPLGTKVFRWLNNEALVGYVGAAQTNSGIRMDKWLPNFILRNSPVTDPASTASQLQTDLQAELDVTKHSIFQCASFTDHGGYQVPEYGISVTFQE